MLIRFIVLLGVVFASPAISANGQNLADVMKKLDEINTKVTDIGGRVAKTESRTDSLEAGLTNLTKRVNDLATRLNEFDERQRELVLATSSGDVLNIRSQMEKPPFRQAFDSAVHDVIRSKTGKFTITNKMPSYQRILVNRVEYGLQPGETRTLDLPPGTVYSELAEEGSKTWMLGPPNYEQSIEIAPSRQRNVTYYRAPEFVNPISPPIYQTTYYPTSSGMMNTYYHAPAYVNSTVYVEPNFVARPTVYVEPTYVARPVVYAEPTYVARPLLVSPPLLVNQAPCPIVSTNSVVVFP